MSSKTAYLARYYDNGGGDSDEDNKKKRKKKKKKSKRDKRVIEERVLVHDEEDIAVGKETNDSDEEDEPPVVVENLETAVLITTGGGFVPEDDGEHRPRKRYDSSSDSEAKGKARRTRHDSDSDRETHQKKSRHDSSGEESEKESRTKRRRHDSDSEDNNSSNEGLKKRRNRYDSDESKEKHKRSKGTRNRHDSDSDRSDKKSRSRRSRHDSDSDESKNSDKSNDKGDEKGQRAKMSSGHKAGLHRAREFSIAEQEIQARKKKEAAAMIDKHGMGDTVYRDAEGRKLQEKPIDPSLAKEKLQQQREMLNQGRLQIQAQQAKLEYEKKLQDSTFARTIQDEDLENWKKQQVREGDPMAKAAAESMASTIEADPNRKPIYKGPPAPPNRYGIRPGYRWDGNPRGNGFERRLLAHKFGQEREKENAYRWSTADM